MTKGSVLLCNTLTTLGVDCVFGLPGTQTVEFYEALRSSSIRSILCTHELAAGFMANGYARASGRVGVIITIPGPGFTYALTALAEAQADSAAILLITLSPAKSPGRAFQNQSIAQTDIVNPLVKEVIEVHEIEDIPSALARAHALALDGEPGPVFFQVCAEALTKSLSIAKPIEELQQPVDSTALQQLVEEVAKARKPVLLIGQGAAGCAAELLKFVEHLQIPVITTTSGRGVIPEDHPLAMAFDSTGGSMVELMEFFASADLILALGAKLSHNGSIGFTIKLDPERFIHVDTASSVLNANYPAKLAIKARAEDAIEALAKSLDCHTQWSVAEIAGWKKRLSARLPPSFPDPTVKGVEEGTMQSFFQCLRNLLPRDAILVTDAGLHQTLVRRYFQIFTPYGLIAPNDFQSMGFGLPAAIGAKLAASERVVVALIGDGGFLMSGMEMLTALRHSIPIILIVFNDGRLNLIRLQQFKEFGRSHDTDILTPNLETFAAAMGARYLRVEGDVASKLHDAIASTSPILVEVFVGDSLGVPLMQAKALSKRTVRTLLGRRFFAWLKKIFLKKATGLLRR